MKTVLVCPLNWGLGHATRCIPLIEREIQKGSRVIIGGDGASLELLRKNFPTLESVDLPKLNIHYSKRFSFLCLCLQIPKVLLWIYKDYQTLTNIVNRYNVDVIISDNRWGIRSKDAYSVFITHQLNVSLPRLMSPMEGVLRYVQNLFLKKFDELWVPDFDEFDESLSGKLSHVKSFTSKTKYIGLLSQFTLTQRNVETKYDFIFIISGPEPQRTAFEMLCVLVALQMRAKAVIVGGKVHEHSRLIDGGFEYRSFANRTELYALILQSKVVVCRSGYTSIMDLVTLGKKAILVPTPGQTEQLYLAQRCEAKKWFPMVPQRYFIANFGKTLELINEYNPPPLSLF